MMKNMKDTKAEVAKVLSYSNTMRHFSHKKVPILKRHHYTVSKERISVEMHQRILYRSMNMEDVENRIQALGFDTLQRLVINGIHQRVSPNIYSLDWVRNGASRWQIRNCIWLTDSCDFAVNFFANNNKN